MDSLKPLSYFIEKRGPLCEYCGAEPATSRHHCLRNKDRRKPYLDDERNIVIVGECHKDWIGTGGRELREHWWKHQCERYGEQDMKDWWTSLPLKVKERFW